jgi:GWxTD domain-containing protein
VVAQDHHHPESMDSLELMVSVPEFSREKVCMSEVVVASQIKRNFKDEEDPFYKNTLRVLPNPARVFVPAKPFLYFYVELYNLQSGIEGSEFTLAYHVLDGDNNVVDEVKPMRRRRANNTETRVEWGALKVGRLITGSYTLHIALMAKDQAVTSKDIRFFVYNEERMQAQTPVAEVDTDKLFITSEFASMQEYTLDDVFEKARYITDSKDRRTFKKLKDIDEKRRWLFDFWDRKNPVEGISPLVFYREYMRRIRYADEEFAGFNLDGWKSDRGRVYIMYGDPSYRHRFPNQSNMRPYEEWHYDNLQGGVMFIFGDLNQTKEYRLIHSDMRGEITNNNWVEILESGQYR